MTGEIICGYRLLRELGSRALPSYAAVDPKPRRPDEALCVVERLAREPGVNAEAAAGFLRDAKRLAQLHHANVVQVRDVVVGTSTVLLVSDWVDGEVLSDIERMAAERSIPIPLAGSLRILIDLLEGLSALHELRDAKREPMRLVHAEVAPRNVVVGVDGRSVLVHPLRAPVGPARSHAPEVVGYLAPEVLLGDQTADQRADVYGAGVLLWEALMGQRMHAEGEDAGEIVMRLLGGKIDPPCAPVDAPWAAPLAEAAKRAVAPDPSIRFANATEMLAELRKNVGARLAPKLAVAALVEAVAGERIRKRNESLGATGAIARLPSESAWTTEAQPAPVAALDPDATKPPPSPAVDRAAPGSGPRSAGDGVQTPSAPASSPSSPPSSTPPSTPSSTPPSSKRRVAPSWGRVLASPAPPRPSSPPSAPSSSQSIRLSEPPTSADVVEVIELDIPLDRPSRPHRPPPVPKHEKGRTEPPPLPHASLRLETPLTQSKTDLGPIALASTPAAAPSSARTKWAIVAACAAAVGAVLWMLTRSGPERPETAEPPAALSAASAAEPPAPPSTPPPVPAPTAAASSPGPSRAANEPSPFDPSPSDDHPAATARAAPSPPPAPADHATAPPLPTAAAPAPPSAAPPVPPSAPAASSPHSKKRVYDPMGI